MLVVVSRLFKRNDRYFINGHIMTLATINLHQDWREIHNDLIALARLLPENWTPKIKNPSKYWGFSLK